MADDPEAASALINDEIEKIERLMSTLAKKMASDKVTHLLIKVYYRMASQITR